MAKQKKVKEPIRIRFKKLSNGNKSVYLDIYRNGQRSYEFLKLYLIPEIGENKAMAKIQNENTMQAVQAIKAQRIMEIANNQAGLNNTSKGKMLLVDWLKAYRQSQIEKGKQDYRQIAFCIKLVEAFNGKVTLQQIDKKFCLGFLDYIQHKYVSDKTHKHINQLTARNYYRCLNSALNSAVQNGMITYNPFTKIAPKDKIKMQEGKREYLTLEEVKRLSVTECKNPTIKQIFMFSVCCGLRIGDITRLTWNDVEVDERGTRIKIIQHKTKEVLVLPLSEQALKYMPERGTESEVFPHICQTTGNQTLKDWAKDADVNKNVSFHVARHTFATLQLTLGEDIYTVSKLLGHTDVSTTQIYAKIIDKKKEEAVNKFNNLF